MLGGLQNWGDKCWLQRQLQGGEAFLEKAGEKLRQVWGLAGSRQTLAALSTKL